MGSTQTGQPGPWIVGRCSATDRPRHGADGVRVAAAEFHEMVSRRIGLGTNHGGDFLRHLTVAKFVDVFISAQSVRRCPAVAPTRKRAQRLFRLVGIEFVQCIADMTMT